MAFKIAGSMAFKEGCQQGQSRAARADDEGRSRAAEEYMGDVIGDLNSRRGRIEGMEARPGTQIVTALVPLSSMFGYATDLRSRTQGRATYTMHFAHYEEVPKNDCRRNHCQSTGQRRREIRLTADIGEKRSWRKRNLTESSRT